MNQCFIENDLTAGSDRSHSQFRLSGQTKLAYNEQV